MVEAVALHAGLHCHVLSAPSLRCLQIMFMDKGAWSSKDSLAFSVACII